VRVDRGDETDETEVDAAYGLAHRAREVPNSVDTQFALASGTKGLTALAVVSLIADSTLDLATTARSLLGDDLPLVGDDVTVEHLLAHRSGIGDYADEDAGLDVDTYELPVPAANLTSTEAYLAALDGYPPKFVPDERFAYCNSGYVVLALIAERAARRPFADLVRDRVCTPAGMGATAFLRLDALPARAATGYVDDGSHTNESRLAVVGSGDGGIFSTAADIAALWRAFIAGRIVTHEWVSEMLRPRSDVPSVKMRYGLGFWLHATQDVVMLEGCDAGVSFRSVHDPAAALTHTVISNTTDGAWPITRHLDELFSHGRDPR